MLVRLEEPSCFREILSAKYGVWVKDVDNRGIEVVIKAIPILAELKNWDATDCEIVRHLLGLSKISDEVWNECARGD